MIDLVLALVVAIALHHLVEVPAQRALVRRSGSARRTTRSDSAEA